MNFLVRGKPDKKNPHLSGGTRSGIISHTNFFFHTPSGLLLQGPVPPGAPELSHGVLGQSVPTELPPSLHALCLGLGRLLSLIPRKSFGRTVSDGAVAFQVLGGLTLMYSPPDGN